MAVEEQSTTRAGGRVMRLGERGAAAIDFLTTAFFFAARLECWTRWVAGGQTVGLAGKQASRRWWLVVMGTHCLVFEILTHDAAKISPLSTAQHRTFLLASLGT